MLNTWLKGLIAALMAGISSGLIVVIVTPNEFNILENWEKLALVIAAHMLLNLGFYLKKSPWD
jgi:hypothetical protein